MREGCKRDWQSRARGWVMEGGWVGGVGSILRIDGLIFYALE